MATRYFELVDGKSSKFWQVEHNELSMVICYGRIGKSGTQQTKEFDSKDAIEKAINKLITEKTKKGYIEIISKSESYPSENVSTDKILMSSSKVQNILDYDDHSHIIENNTTQNKENIDLNTPPWFKTIEDIVIDKSTKLKTLPTRKNPIKKSKPNLTTSFSKIRKLLISNDRCSIDRCFININTSPEYASLLDNTFMLVKQSNAEGDFASDAVLYALVAYIPMYNDPKYNNDCIVEYLIAKGGLNYAIDVFLKAQTYAIHFNNYNQIMLSDEVTKPIGLTHGNQYSFAELSFADWLSNTDEHTFKLCESKLINALDQLHFSRKPLIALLLPDNTALANQIADSLVSQGYENKFSTGWLSLVVTDEALLEKLKNSGILVNNNNFNILLLIVGTWYNNLGTKALDIILSQVSHFNVELAKILLPIGFPQVFKVIAKQTFYQSTLKVLLHKASMTNPLATYVSYVELFLEEKVPEFVTNNIDQILSLHANDIPRIYPWVNNEVKEFTLNALAKQQKNKSITDDDVFAEQHELPPILVSPPWLLKKKKKLSAINVDFLQIKDEIVDFDNQQIINYLNDTNIKQRIDCNKTTVSILKNAGMRINSVVANNPNHFVLKAAEAIDNNEIDAMVEALQFYSDDWHMNFNLAFTVHLPDAAVLAIVENCSQLKFNRLDYLIYRFGSNAIKSIIAYSKKHPILTANLWQYIASSQLAPIVAKAYSSNKKMKKVAQEWSSKFPEHCIIGLIPFALGTKNEYQKKAQTMLRQLYHNGHEKLILEITERYKDQKITDHILAILHEDPLELYHHKINELPNFWQPQLWHRPRLIGTNKVLDNQAIAYLGTMLQFPTSEGIYEGINIIKNLFEPNSLANFAWDLFQSWDKFSGLSKDNWAFKALGILGNDDSARKLFPLIRLWPGESLHQRAILGLEILELIGSDVALMLLNSIAQKNKYKGLQDKAKEKIAEIAEKRNLSVDELEDRLAPNLGLDENCVLILDFGPRQFKVSFDETLKPLVRDMNGTRLKDLPKPKQSDDIDKSAEAVNRFKALKKDAKIIADQEIFRLEKAMCLKRRWETGIFVELFVKHPVIRHLVDKLVWGVYKVDQDEQFGGELVNCFRVAEDGTYTDQFDESFELPEDANFKIGIPHLLEMTEQNCHTFGQLFADYEIIQPFKQLGREIYQLTEEEMNSKHLNRFDNISIFAGKIFGLKLKGWIQGPVWDGGIINEYFKPISKNQYIRINFSEGIYVGDLSYLAELTIDEITISSDMEELVYVENSPTFSVLDKIDASEFIRDMMNLIAKE